MSKYLNHIILFLSVFLLIIVSFVIYLAARPDYIYDFNVFKMMDSPDHRLIERPVSKTTDMPGSGLNDSEMERQANE